MLSIRTTDDWTTVQMTWDNGVDPSENFTPSSSVASAYEAVEELVAWLDTTFSGEVSGWAISAGALGGWLIQIACSASTYTVTSNAAAQSLLGFPASVGPTATPTATAEAAGTVYGRASVQFKGWQRDPSGEGSACSSGAVLAGSPGTSSRKPQVAIYLDATESTTFTNALSYAANPRVVHVWHPDDSTWRILTLGQIARSREAGTWWRHDLDVRG